MDVKCKILHILVLKKIYVLIAYVPTYHHQILPFIRQLSMGITSSSTAPKLRESLDANNQHKGSNNPVLVKRLPVDVQWHWFEDISVKGEDGVYVALNSPRQQEKAPLLPAGTDYPAVRVSMS